MKARAIMRTEIIKILKNNQYFLIPFLATFVIAMALLAIHGNSALYLFVNQHNSSFADFWFLRFTQLGDGTVAFLLILMLMWVSFREALTLLLITLIITILFAVLKRFVFPDFDRPLLYFGEQIIRVVPGYNPPKLRTFPSGHTATAFSVYLYLSFLTRQHGIKFGLFLVACAIGYSRIYLSAHFPADVFFGSFFAVLITTATYFYCKRINASWLDLKFVFKPFKVPTRQTAQS